MLSLHQNHYLKMYLQIAGFRVNGSLENHRELSSMTRSDSWSGEDACFLLTVMIMHATQMAQIILCNKRAVLIGPKTSGVTVEHINVFMCTCAPEVH